MTDDDDGTEMVRIDVTPILLHGEARVGLLVDGELVLSAPPSGARGLAEALTETADDVDRYVKAQQS